MRRKSKEACLMKVVHKFPVTQAWEQTFEVSEGAQVLDIELSDGQSCVWILLDPNHPRYH
ncbi:DUF7352 domain-containing protein [Acinetobacter lwoffii]